MLFVLLCTAVELKTTMPTPPVVYVGPGWTSAPAYTYKPRPTGKQATKHNPNRIEEKDGKYGK